jgi:formamidopyrimidine-DNA glycosylase
MAELPDLTVFAQILSRKFKGQTLERIEVTVANKLKVTVETLREALEGHELTRVSREGKTLQFHFSGGQVLGLHLMLRGELVDLEPGIMPRFQVMAFHFKTGGGFAVTDILKQATPTLQPASNTVPDALAISKEYFTALLAKKRMLIKTLLMDQKVLRGIGNSYADEILYDAGISPFSTANALPAKAVARLMASIKTVLDKATENIAGANGDELAGELRDFLEIHNPHLKLTSKDEPIKRDKIGGRTTYYTDHQELYI